MMQRIIFTALLLCAVATCCLAQNIETEEAITAIDFVKAKPGELENLIRYYELNWAEARRLAKKKKFVKSYQMYLVRENPEYDVILLTVYKNQAQFDKREANFQHIFEKYKPNSTPVDGKGGKELREIVDSQVLYQPKNRSK